MTSDGDSRIARICEAALDLGPAERAAFLAEECAGDDALRREVEGLLAHKSAAEHFIDAAALDVAARWFAGATSMDAGVRIGPYEVVSPLGAGGMGEVYRARDGQLGRDVAIKILPPIFLSDPERLARFEREARVLASLNHPNIAAIYAVELVGSGRALVLELVEGVTLQERLARQRGLPLDAALPLARQIAEALGAAHDKSIVHRDLKPANIKITPTGVVKVLDFGVAKLTAADAPGADVTHSPTLTMDGTRKGILLGTAAYMSPEQARGQVVDKRTDIWAFGCVLYEMLTGRVAFAGATLTDTLAAIIERDPDWNQLPTTTPTSVRKLLRRCLEKDATRRLHDIADARFEIDDALAEPDDQSRGRTKPAGEIAATVPARASSLAWIVAAVAAVMIAILVIPAIRYLRETPAQLPPEMRVDINTPARTAPLEFALSPDGRQIVFVASADGPQRLWLRALDKTDAQPIAGTDGADYPFWSADSRSIGYFARGKLNRIDLGRGRPQVLADAPGGRGGTWNLEGTILFSPRGGGSPLLRIPASGGEPVPVTHLDPPRQGGHIVPQFLPDGRHFLFYAYGVSEQQGIYLGSLDAGEAKRLTAADTAGSYLEPGFLVFVRQGALVAQRLDTMRGQLLGDVMPLAESVSYDVGFAIGAFSVSRDGRVAYRVPGAGRDELSWFDRTGKALGVIVGPPDANHVANPELSPDGGRLAITADVRTNVDIWVIDLVRGPTRFTSDQAVDAFPVWSPDGTQILFNSVRNGRNHLYLKHSNGAGAEQALLEAPGGYPQDWSRDGRFLLYSKGDPKMGRNVWALDMTSHPRTPRAVVNTPFEERNSQFSPDGRWVAYETNESGRFEIVVQSFPEPTGIWHVSIDGGTQVRWRADGHEIYFISADGKLMGAPVTASRSRFETGKPVALFSTRIAGGGATAFRPQYAVSRDGRFLINQPAAESTTTPITLILNWRPPPQ